MSYGGNIPRFFVFDAFVQFYLWMPIWVIYFQQRGLTLTQIGVLDAIGWVLMAFAEVPTGAFADRLGRKSSLIVGAALLSASMFALTAEVLSPIFVLGFIAWGVSFTFFSGADTALLYDSLRAEGRVGDYPRLAGRHMAVVQTSQGLGALVGGWVATYDMSLCFTMSGACAIAAAGVAATLREPTHRDASATPSYWRTMAEAARVAAGRPVVRHLVLLGATTSVFPFLLGFMALQPYASAAGVAVWTLGPIVLARSVAAVLGSLAAARIAGRVGPGAVLLASQAAIVVSMWLLAALASPAAMGLFLVVALANGLARPVLSSLLNAEIPSAQRATIISLQSLLWTILLAVVEPLIFVVADTISIAFAIGVAGTVFAAAATLLLALWRRASMRAASPSRGEAGPPG